MPRKKKETATFVRKDDVAPVFALNAVLELGTPTTRTRRLIVATVRQYRMVRDLAWGRSGGGEDFGCMIAESIISPRWFKYRP